MNFLKFTTLKQIYVLLVRIGQKVNVSKKHFFALSVLILVVMVSFQNCSTSGFNSASSMGQSEAIGSPPPPGPNGSAKQRLVFNVKDKEYGALGDGQTDDTFAINKAIEAAEAKGGILFFPVGTFIIKNTLETISAGVTVRGMGYQGGNFNSSFGPASVGSLGSCSCIVQKNPQAGVFSAGTSDAVAFENLVIYYQTPAAPGTAAILINGGDPGNTQSLIRDVMVSGADVGISFFNSINWIVDNNFIYNSQSFGLVSNTNWQNSSASYGDFGITNNTFMSRAPKSVAMIELLANGGRIFGNVFWGNGTNNGIVISPQLTIADFSIEPVQIVGNNLQGFNYGVSFALGPASNGTTWLGTITGNQFGVNVGVHGDNNANWVHDWAMTSNIMQCQSQYCVDMPGALNVNVTQNTFYVPDQFVADQGVNVPKDANNNKDGNNTLKGAAGASNVVGASVPLIPTASNGLVGVSASTQVFNVKDYGALGDGSDDTQAILNAINDAQAAGGTVFFPAGNFNINKTIKTKSALIITRGITVQGVGYQSAGTNFLTTGPVVPPVKSANLKNASVIIQNDPTLPIFDVTTSDSVAFYGLELYYANCEADVAPDAICSTTGSGIPAIKISGSDHPYLRDMFIHSADIAVSFLNSAGWVLDNVMFYAIQSNSVSEDGNQNSVGWVIKNCNFETDTYHNSRHILIKGSAGGSIISTKLNLAGAWPPTQDMNGIEIAPSAAHRNIQVAPITVMAASIEGVKYAIVFTSNGAGATSSNGVIVGSQLWSNIAGVYSDPNTATPWISGWTINGNAFYNSGDLRGGSPPPPVYGVEMGGATGMTVSGNVFYKQDNAVYFAQTAGNTTPNNLISH